MTTLWAGSAEALSATFIMSGVLWIDSVGVIWRMKQKVGGNQGPRWIDIEPRPAGKLMPNGRLQVQIYFKGRRYVCSSARIIWFIHHGEIPDGHHIHHKNGNPRDDRPENLECLLGADHISSHYEDKLKGMTYEQKCRETKRLYRNGLTKAEVARATGVTHITARRRLRHREKACADED